MIKTKSAMPSAEMQRRARELAVQASKLAEQAGPATRKAATTARQSAGGAAEWARPRVGQARTWMAAQAARSSVGVSETVAPKVSAMLATTARKLEPPRPKAGHKGRRILKILAGTMLVGAGAAATVLRGRSRRTSATPGQPPSPGTGPSATTPTPGTEADRKPAESEYNGMSRTL